MSAVRDTTKHVRRHDDTPDTDADFRRLAGLPEGPERELLIEGLVEAWLPMAHRLARRFRARGEQLEDLEQVAALGLVKAVDRYDPSQGPFQSYAVPSIVGEVKRHFRDHSWHVHVPRRVQELRNKVRVAVRELTVTADDRSPTIARIAAHAGLTEEEVLTGMEAIESFRALSLDAQLQAGQDDFSLADTLGQTEGSYDTVLDRETVKPHLADLPERERRILHLRFFHDMTQARIGEELGISQMHVSRLIKHACTQVREQVHDDAARRPLGVAA
ncbi:SigB/SigF/SigG family RNA polymerase sigma factor [Streptomyces sp. RKND-216]|uniref:SigB/SigF/SigG family RNA polymerase sigma factor n=1 Tax=Streptomyces sp. RKND-216 TaxID=2562581 RepID=UPI00109DB81C|nr:SigB/SigF/SigG family RNA polymerase sigma factor [Streptomyces sp. RKND-216]THA24406.1 SigB/SigF/SigG family RNA polymerase sigma factor [Streptomyces sp. RKND-216]